MVEKKVKLELCFPAITNRDFFLCKREKKKKKRSKAASENTGENRFFYCQSLYI